MARADYIAAQASGGSDQDCTPLDIQDAIICMAQVAETNATLPSHEDDGHEPGTQGMLCGVEQLGGKSGEKTSFGSGRIQGKPALEEAESRRSMDDVVRSAGSIKTGMHFQAP